MTAPSVVAQSTPRGTQNFVSSLVYEGYLATRYEVALDRSRAIARIGRRCPSIESFLMENKCAAGHIITAYNPYNCRSSDTDNLKQNYALIDWADRQNILWRPSRNSSLSRGNEGTPGYEGTGGWPDEPGCFLVGLTLQDATEIARTFQQAAVVSVAVGHAAALVMAI